MKQIKSICKLEVTYQSNIWPTAASLWAHATLVDAGNHINLELNFSSSSMLLLYKHEYSAIVIWYSTVGT